MEDKLEEYACVNIDGVLHITISGSQCACGKRYSFTTLIESGNYHGGPTPLLWLPACEVTCVMCREIAANHEKELKQRER